MNDQMQAAIIALVAKVGLNLAINILEGIGKATTIDEAITALKASAAKTWDDYKAEAGAPK